MRSSLRRWWLVAAAACSTHETPFPFGGPDASIDGLPPATSDAGPGSVTLTVTQGGAPVAGAAVYFQNHDSTLVAAVSTDGNGTAGAVVAPAAYVTVFEPPDGSGFPKLATFGSVQPGDALHLDLPPMPAPNAAEVTLTVPKIDGAASYQVYSSCGSGAVGPSGTGMFQLLGCGSTADLIVIASDGLSPLGSLWAPAQLLDSGPIVLGGNYGAFVPTSCAYSDVPSGMRAVGTYSAILTDRGTVFSTTSSCVPSTGACTAVAAMPATTGTTALTVTDGVPAAGATSEQEIFDWGPWDPSYSLDVRSAVLRTFLSLPQWEQTAHEVTWMEGPGAPPDVERLAIRVSRDGIPLGTTWTWTLVDAGKATSLVFPLLPGAASMFNPIDGDSIAIDDLTSASVPGGYDAVRAHGFDDFTDLVSGPSGRIVVQRSYTPPL